MIAIVWTQILWYYKVCVWSRGVAFTLLSCACGRSVSTGSSRSCAWPEPGPAGRRPVSPRSGRACRTERAPWSSSTSTRRRNTHYWLDGKKMGDKKNKHLSKMHPRQHDNNIVCLFACLLVFLKSPSTGLTEQAEARMLVLFLFAFSLDSPLSAGLNLPWADVSTAICLGRVALEILTSALKRNCC